MTGKEPTDHWDERADGWDDTASHYAALAHESLMTALTARGLTLDGATVCDFGCGTGLLTERLADIARSIDAVDTSTAMIAQLDAKIEQRGFTHVHTSSSLPPSVETHDLIVCSSVLGFVSDYQGTVEDLVRLLRPGGVLVQWDWEKDEADTEAFGLTRVEIHRTLTDAGLTAVGVAAAFEIAIEGETVRPLMGIGQKR